MMRLWTIVRTFHIQQTGIPVHITTHPLIKLPNVGVFFKQEVPAHGSFFNQSFEVVENHQITRFFHNPT